MTGGEIARRDWSDTSLGPLDGWPASLRSTLSLMLACPTPMFLAWGPDLLCFYNDAYRPVLGYRVDTALGAPFKTVWSSIWSDIQPLVEATIAGETRVMVDMPLDLGRRGVPEESWWTFSYSPAFDDAGGIAGLFCVTGETTARLLAERARQTADERLQMALSAGNSIGAWDWDVSNDRVTADTRFALLYGVDPAEAAAGAPLADFFAGIHPDDRERVQREIGATVEACGTFLSEYRLRQQDGGVRWVSAQGRCIPDESGRCARLPGVSFDITDRITADRALKAAKEEREFVVSITTQQRKLADPDAIIRLTAEALGRWLGTHRAGFYRLTGPDRVRYVGGWTDGTIPPLLGDEDVDAFGPYAAGVLRKGVTLVFGDSRSDERRRLRPYANGGVLAGLCVPLLDEDGRWQAGVDLHHAAVRHWTATEIALAKEVAELTWRAVERAEALLRLARRVDLQDAELAQGALELSEQTAGRLAAEGQVRQLQKMEAVGQLTGGLAHDFNNMLAVIIGSLNLMERRLARGETNLGKYVDAAMDGANRAAALTQRLLAFSRQQPLSPEPVDCNRLVSGLSDLLTRTLGEPVQLETILSRQLWRARVDPGQLENTLVNLAVNARDAMPGGGKLTIETANAHVEADFAGEYEIAVGQYVVIAVTDTGTGMTADVMSKAFDPFFTTKGVGKGTGLGLSQVFGFMRQSGGHVRLQSEAGQGATFRLYLPRFYGEAATFAPRPAAMPPRGGQPSEIILVVEDEDRVRAYSIEALRELGYTVLHAASGREALAIIEAGQDVTLLFTDVVMPEMTGRQLTDHALALLPGLKVVYTTGYTRDAVVHDGVLDPGTNLLAKPFGIDQLAAVVRNVLDAGK